MKILITPRGFAKYGLKQISQLEAMGYEVDYNNTGLAYDKNKFKELAKDADAIIVGVDIIDKDVIDNCPNLKVICKFGVGTDNIDVDYAKEKGIVIERTIGSNSVAVAELVMGFMYLESRYLFQNLTEVKQGLWNKLTGRELYNKTIGIIGFGAIGKLVAKSAVGIGMQVVVYDIYEISEDILNEYSIKQLSLDDLLKTSDYVTLHLPLTNQTKNLIDEKQLSIMKPDACLINAARGGIVNEKALALALENKIIRSACFDVFSSEPPSIDNELLVKDNFYLTSHIGSRTNESETRTCEISMSKIVNVLRGFKNEN